MYRVPFEIWTKISSYACTDTGFTGRSLSLVSKFIRDASASVKIQSIAAHGQEIEKLEEVLLRTPLHLRYVRYLFISTNDREKLVLSDDCGEIDDCGEFDIEEEEMWEGPMWEEAPHKLMPSCHRILRVLADSIEILYLNGLASTPAVFFPRLEELASVNYPRDDFPSDDSDALRAWYPRLQRWHLVSYSDTWAWKRPEKFTAISTFAPCITHLMFSDLPVEADFPSDLAVALGVAIPPGCLPKCAIPLYMRGQSAATVGKLPSSTERVYLNPRARPSSHDNPQYHFSYAELITGLEALHGLDSRIVLLQSYANQQEIRFTESEWEERVNGGDGFWSLCDRIQ